MIGISTKARRAGRARPGRDVAIALALKLALLALIAQLFFPSARRPHVDADSVARHFLTPGNGDAP